MDRLRRQSAERELDEEVRFHLEMEAERLEARGLEPTEARRRARLAFGGIEKVKEECRDERRGHAVELFLHDARLAGRSLLRNRGYTAAVVLTLALGIGANSAVFSLINGVLLQPLPYRDGKGLVLLHQSQPRVGDRDLPFSIREAEEVRRLNRSFSQLVEYHSMFFTLLGRGEPERVRTGVVSADFFELLGVVPLHGRTFRADDDAPRAEAVLVLAHDYWQRSFGGDPEIVGQTFEMNNRPHTVVGVLPPVPQFPQDNDVYMPTSACPFRAAAAARQTDRRAFSSLRLVGRLRSEISVAAARADLTRLAERFRHDHPDVYRDDRGYRITAVPLKEELTHRARPMLLLLLGTTTLVLLIACANVTSLTVARQLRCGWETAVRTARGAGRGRLARQELTENLLLSLAGGALGLGLAYGGLDLLVAFTARFTPRAEDVDIDGWVLIFTLTTAILTALLATGLTRLSGPGDPARALRESSGGTASRRKLRLRAALVAAQVAVSVMLLMGAGLMLRSLDKLRRVDLGLETERVLAARIPLNWSKYDSDESTLTFFSSLLDRLRAHPGVRAAAMASDLPLGRQAAHEVEFLIEDRPLEDGGVAPRLDLKVASPGYFRTLGIPLLEGRAFALRDDAAATPVAMINRSLARHHWGGENPLGAKISMDGGESWRTVVGVVGDVHDFGPAAPAADQLYVPLAQSGWSQYLLLRTAVDPSTLKQDVKEVVRILDPDQPVIEIETLAQMRRASTASPRSTSWLLGLFAALALLITAAGLAGVISFAVNQRRHEIGIRMALGARRPAVMLLILRQGVTLVTAGLTLGLFGAVLWGRAFEDFLFGIRPTDPLTLASVALVLLTVTGTACFIPARRATCVDPTVALKSD